MRIVDDVHPAEAAGVALTELLREHAAKPMLVLVSGGSALALLDFVDPDVLGPHLTLSVLDERFSIDPTINNCAQLEQTALYAAAVDRGATLISTRVGEGDAIEAVRDRFSTALHDWRARNPDGVMIATMGMGPDGHTAGIFPGEHGVDFSGDDWVVSYTVPVSVNQYPDRITVTYTFLRTQLNAVIVYAVGSDKYARLLAMQSETPALHAVPAAIFNEIPNLVVYTKNE